MCDTETCAQVLRLYTYLYAYTHIKHIYIYMYIHIIHTLRYLALPCLTLPYLTLSCLPLRYLTLPYIAFNLCCVALLHYCITALLHYCITALLHYCITALLHYCITWLHYITLQHITSHYITCIHTLWIQPPNKQWWLVELRLFVLGAHMWKTPWVSQNEKVVKWIHDAPESVDFN